MKRSAGRMNQRGEGWLLAILLGMVLLSALIILVSRLPRTVRLKPAHAVLQPLEDAESAPLNLNDATAEELARLPGIGEELARRIVEYRREQGSFASVDQLDAVPGIGEGRLDALAGLVCVKYPVENAQKME